MNRPYTFKIMAALPGHDAIELFRSSIKYSQAVWNFYTRGLSQEWTCWTEHTMHDKDCLSERPYIRDPHVAAVASKLRLYPANPHQE